MAIAEEKLFLMRITLGLYTLIHNTNLLAIFNNLEISKTINTDKKLAKYFIIDSRNIITFDF